MLAFSGVFGLKFTLAEGIDEALPRSGIALLLAFGGCGKDEMLTALRTSLPIELASWLGLIEMERRVGTADVELA